MHAAFNDNGVETCEGNYAPPYNDRYFWFNCISGYSLQINEDLNDQHRWSITYSTPHGGFDWIAYSSVVSGTELATIACPSYGGAFRTLGSIAPAS